MIFAAQPWYRISSLSLKYFVCKVYYKLDLFRMLHTKKSFVIRFSFHFYSVLPLICFME